MKNDTLESKIETVKERLETSLQELVRLESIKDPVKHYDKNDFGLIERPTDAKIEERHEKEIEEERGRIGHNVNLLNFLTLPSNDDDDYDGRQWEAMALDPQSVINERLAKHDLLGEIF